MGDLELELRGYRLTLAEITYWVPDHPRLLQTFTWQTLDLAPRFPILHRFLDHWRREIEAKAQSVRVATAPMVGRGELRHARHLALLQ
ncbi:MAG: Usg family protein [Alphaproteobacteria bacterium]|nr:Usg family protein [Alphaproteobacteria bacterium]